ncbi:MAG: hypothetical protein KKA73_16020 [Chloroflexi bacterium]|nr:hypothetical protein [Chloroflexota bacterium]
MHNVQPNQKVRIVQLEVAVPGDADPGEIADLFSNMLSGALVLEPDGLILDWAYTGLQRYVTAPADPAEGEVFYRPGDVAAAVLDWATSMNQVRVIAVDRPALRQQYDMAGELTDWFNDADYAQFVGLLRLLDCLLGADAHLVRVQEA